MTMKKMFKVLCPMEGRNGSKWWMKCGTGFPNKDESINVYLDSIPNKPGFTLQLREYTEEDMKQSADRRASYAARPTTSVHASERHGDYASMRADASFEPGTNPDELSPPLNQGLPF